MNGPGIGYATPKKASWPTSGVCSFNTSTK